MKVFLGGTCNGSNWRDEIIDKLNIDYFNPVVENWDEESFSIELKEKESSDYFLFVLTPLMKGFYSVAEVVDYSNKYPSKTIFCILDNDKGESWSQFDKRSLSKTKDLVKANGAIVLDSLEEIVDFLQSGI